MDEQNDGLPPYEYIEKNDFVHRKHSKQKEEDVAICICLHDANDPDSACGERCLNVLTSTECTPGYCPCGIYCKNQRFQKCEYAMSKLLKTEDRGWGLLAAEDIKAGQFVIEYCGEVISWKEAKRRAQAYEAEGLKDAFIICLSAFESIDATRKGSMARFINHSCQPNCETRKWTVLGEVRVGIFAKQDIPARTELSYDYNFEWYGGSKIRCLCGASCCSGFLGAKSRGFQEATYLWEDDDERYSVENVPLYDSEDDERSSKDSKAIILSNDMLMANRDSNYFLGADGIQSTVFPQSEPIAVEPLNSVPMEIDEVKNEAGEDSPVYAHGVQQNFAHKSAMISRILSNSACRNYHIDSSPLSKRSAHYPNGKFKNHPRKQVDFKNLVGRLVSDEARQQISDCEESKNSANSRLDSLYDEIRPAIEEHERDNQDAVSTTVAEKWIEASCSKLKTEFDYFSTIIKTISCKPREGGPSTVSQAESSTVDGIKISEYGE